MGNTLTTNIRVVSQPVKFINLDIIQQLFSLTYHTHTHVRTIPRFYHLNEHTVHTRKDITNTSKKEESRTRNITYNH